MKIMFKLAQILKVTYDKLSLPTDTLIIEIQADCQLLRPYLLDLFHAEKKARYYALIDFFAQIRPLFSIKFRITIRL